MTVASNNTPKRIVFLGPPGAGKGTQSIRLTKEQGLVHISTGDILRGAIHTGTSLGLQAQQYMLKGELVPDAVVIGVIEERVKEKDCEHGFLLDGFPRTVAQAIALDAILDRNKIPLTNIFDLKVSDEHLISRIEKRASEQNRPDDDPGVFRNRLSVYRTQTAPVRDYYDQRKRVVEIDGVGTFDEVYNRIVGKF